MRRGWATPLLGFDTETTGTSISSDRIVQVALVERRAGTARTRTWLTDPGIPIPEAAARVHGISTEKARAEGADRRQVVDEVAGYLAQADRYDVPIVIFNAIFDLPLIEAEARRLGVAGVIERAGRVPFVIDPLVIDRALDPYRKGKRQLAHMAAHYGVRGDETLHDAGADVRQTLLVWDAIVERHPELREWGREDFAQRQAQAHARWARSMNAWLESKGRVGDVEVEWPLAGGGPGGQQ